MKRWLVVAFLVIASSARAQPTHMAPGDVAGGPIEDQAPTIQLMSFGVGARIFEKFGHSALCLEYNDPRNLSVCFNYGVTDFSDGPIMIWHFPRTARHGCATSSTSRRTGDCAPGPTCRIR